MSAPGAPQLGVCFYPEQWPRETWPEHAARMRELGLDVVRIGEFAWSRLEPRAGAYDFEWLDAAIDTLHAAGLGVILGTPTACPPKWLVDAHPDILPVDADGRTRGFGSRRHYCFSSPTYLAESRRIVSVLAERYARHAAIVGWQLDNEYGHHDTTQSFSAAARAAFRDWLRERYGSVEAMDAAWGNVFWSMEHPSFDAVEPPNGAVTETNPAHRLAWQRFSSDQVGRYNRAQLDVLRPHLGEGVYVTHNCIGNFTDFDHYPLGKDLDVVTWDSYPLGFLEQLWFDEATRCRYRQTGHPDMTAFHHDLYRGVGRGRFGVMEQQPGPVNWAPYNAAPLPGMVRLWAWEAIAHGAELVSFFRWQQAPFAQEQTHAGLQRPDGSEAPAFREVRALARELCALELDSPVRAPVAIVFDYGSRWLTTIQPHSASYDALEVQAEWYGALRCLGLDVDIVPMGAPLDGYRLVVCPSLLVLDDAFIERVRSSGALSVFGPRSGSRDAEASIPGGLAPGALRSLVDLRVTEVDTLRPGAEVRFEFDGADFHVDRWLEHVETELEPSARTRTGAGVLFRSGGAHYIAGLVRAPFLAALFARLCDEAGLDMTPLDGGLRLRRRGSMRFAMNYGPQPATLPAVAGPLLLGCDPLPVGGVAAWREN